MAPSCGRRAAFLAVAFDPRPFVAQRAKQNLRLRRPVRLKQVECPLQAFVPSAAPWLRRATACDRPLRPRQGLASLIRDSRRLSAVCSPVAVQRRSRRSVPTALADDNAWIPLIQQRLGRHGELFRAHAQDGRPHVAERLDLNNTHQGHADGIPSRPNGDRAAEFSKPPPPGAGNGRHSAFGHDDGDGPLWQPTSVTSATVHFTAPTHEPCCERIHLHGGPPTARTPQRAVTLKESAQPDAYGHDT